MSAAAIVILISVPPPKRNSAEPDQSLQAAIAAVLRAVADAADDADTVS
jgi:hypothetical protein